MSKIVLISPDYKKSYGDIDINYINYKIIPFGLAYLASILKKYGHDVKIIDLSTTGEPLSRLKAKLEKEKPDFLGISCVTPSLGSAIKIAELSKNTSKKIKVILGGYHPTALPFDVIKNENIDFVLMGECEKSIVELINKTPLEEIKGIVYKKKGRILKNPQAKIISNLNKLPFPYYAEFYKTKDDIKKYGTLTSSSATGIIESRGCPYNCIFCSNKLINKGYVRTRSFKNVISEIEMLHQKYGISNFMFYDSALILDKIRLNRFCQEIIERGLKIKWACSARVNLVDKEILSLMKNAGCYSIYFGIESGDSRILKIIKKEITTKQVRKAIFLTKKRGISCIGLFMIGHPFETRNSVEKTIKLAKILPLDYAGFNIVIPLPGTELWCMAKNKQGLEIITKNWYYFSAYGVPAIRTASLTGEQLRRYQIHAYKHFYFRLSYILRRTVSSQNFIQDLKKSIVLLKCIIKSK